MISGVTLNECDTGMEIEKGNSERTRDPNAGGREQGIDLHVDTVDGRA